jgi:mono/diheme cytochrome c family protein
MREPSWRKLLVEGWVYAVIAVIAFAGGFVVGDLGSSPKTETVAVVASSGEAEEAATGETSAEEGGEAAASEPGAQVFIANGCGSCHTFAAAGTTGTTGPDLNEYLAPDDDAAGVEEMIVDPEAEIAEGYSGGIMPHTYGETLSEEELEQLIQFLVNNSPAGGEEEEGPGGEESDVGGPSN